MANVGTKLEVKEDEELQMAIAEEVRHEDPENAEEVINAAIEKGLVEEKK